MTSEPEAYPRDRTVKKLFESNPGVFTTEPTDAGEMARALRDAGRWKRNAGDLAITDFMGEDWNATPQTASQS